MEKGRTESLHFLSNFHPLFPLKMAEIEIYKQQCKKNFSQIRQNKGFISSSLPGKNMITICNIWAIFARRQKGVTSQRIRIKIWQILFHPHYSWSISCIKNFDSVIFQFCGCKSQRAFQKSFDPDSQVWLLFLVLRLHFRKQ